MAILTKPALRTRILAARRAVPTAARAAETKSLQTQISALAADAGTVCGYIPVGSEPGAAAGDSVPMLDGLSLAGVRVLVPIARTGMPMQWAEYRAGVLVPAPFGLREPPPPWLAPESIAEASVILVPALAVDRRGVRLGRGAGFYDRALPMAAPSARLIAVVRDEEVVDELPAEPHDVPMTHALTPGRGLVALGSVE
ncbi:5-formyltetrahydrofolate cyclo-ligase [Mycolicibacterium diernhoferi]|uniref:5-formyltetrahydrofolate cyclo-ligase n=1 Tax=Mycolicibacterium diernhoferi TaxID=1801 RepID=A0A1Q4H6M1_9MYCO|nr:5-formyltetrahydrofolate cyclo-ligase [Mycolicibacterium diernhoferi]OJZ63137.1 5-formyltetrahydrofolate cyclo-ligase [Mycolicibacterium diernhoferi]OPE52171.1 5-formyltetrahydrofolate cyclo-ligase [Mycolicibacterium diernhoferi]PEG53183.1 5-formyltetrahydrofolate cyclo-ligase [Mycolicibacterium diernhoferi]QYL21913.1 5-formyltetrahydrofolate cyclo-ligase [Mycolicibacterium diernhoferi]